MATQEEAAGLVGHLEVELERSRDGQVPFDRREVRHIFKGRLAKVSLAFGAAVACAVLWRGRGGGAGHVAGRGSKADAAVIGLAGDVSFGTAAAAGTGGAAASFQGAATQGQTAQSTSAASGRIGSFLVLGDWGWDPKVHGSIENIECQQKIADAMAQKMQELGDVKFVINVGDSFYPGGVASKEDWQWEAKWRQVFSQELRSVPWYSVYGNHDYHRDNCACGDAAGACAQVNADMANKDFFYMPGYTWFHEHPELGLEVVALDMNYYMDAWQKDKNFFLPHAPGDCQYTPCPAKCVASLKARAEESFALFYRRAATSKAKNLVVFSHYPTDYFWWNKNFLRALSNNTAHHIEYFGGHRHNVDQSSTISTAPNNNWLVGGGGGWGCEKYAYPPKQGFVVAEISSDFSIHTYPVLVEYGTCCYGITYETN